MGSSLLVSALALLADDEVRGLLIAALSALLVIGTRKLRAMQGVVLPENDRLIAIRPYIDNVFGVLSANGLLPLQQCIIVSGYRSAQEQEETGKGIKDSYHLIGQAVDIAVTDSMAAARVLIAAQDRLGPLAEIIGYPGPYTQPIVHVAWEPRRGMERAPFLGVKTFDGVLFPWKEYRV